MPSLRSALALAVFSATVVASIATSPPPSPGVGLQVEQQGQLTLSDAEPRATLHFTASLNALANRALPDGGLPAVPTSASLRVTWFPVEVSGGADGGDAGAVTAIDAGNPQVEVRFGGAGTSLALFGGCAVGSACSQPVDLDFVLTPDGPRTVSVTWSITGEAQGDALNPNPPGALFTLTSP